MRELQEPDTMDYHKVIKAKVDKISTKKKLINFSFMRKERPRDEFMYNQTDFLTNIKLENSKSTRKDEIDKQKKERKERGAS